MTTRPQEVTPDDRAPGSAAPPPAGTGDVGSPPRGQESPADRTPGRVRVTFRFPPHSPRVPAASRRAPSRPAWESAPPPLAPRRESSAFPAERPPPSGTPRGCPSPLPDARPVQAPGPSRACKSEPWAPERPAAGGHCAVARRSRRRPAFPSSFGPRRDSEHGQHRPEATARCARASLPRGGR